MTNINCSLNCAYQKEGKCCLENVNKCIFKNQNNGCAYFVNNSVEIDNLRNRKSNILN